jgi:hypothetical protein
MKLFKLLSQDWAVELRATQQILIQFARGKSSQPIKGLGGVKELRGEKDTIVAVPLGNGSWKRGRRPNPALFLAAHIDWLFSSQAPSAAAAGELRRSGGASRRIDRTVESGLHVITPQAKILLRRRNPRLADDHPPPASPWSKETRRRAFEMKSLSNRCCKESLLPLLCHSFPG